MDLAGTNSKDKLTHAGLYGVETSMATLGNLYGINVGHYIRINFAGFINIVDARAAWTCILTRPSPQWAARLLRPHHLCRRLEPSGR